MVHDLFPSFLRYMRLRALLSHGGRVRPTRWITRTALLVVCGMVGILGCSGDTTEPAPPGNQTQLYIALQLNQHAINMAVHDTMRLTATALTSAGTPLTSTGQVRFTTQDSSVTVDSTGLVTANLPTPLTIVTARVTVHGVTQTDSAIIQVTPTAPAPLVGLTIQLPPGQATKIAVNHVYPSTISFPGNFPVLSHKATDAGGDSLPPLLVNYTSSDPFVAIVASSSNVEFFNGQLYFGDGVLYAFKVGPVTISADTWAYGVAKRSSLALVIAPPRFAKIFTLAETPVASLTQIGTFYPPNYIIGVGGIVTWEDDSADVPIDVVFDDSNAVQPGIDSNSFAFILCQRIPGNVCPTPTGAGNILPFQADQNGPADRSRAFPTAGTYKYHSRLYGTQGTIIVR
jgi:hypothetical protein